MPTRLELGGGSARLTNSKICRLESASYDGKVYSVGVQVHSELSGIQFVRTGRAKEDRVGLNGLAGRKVSAKLIHVISRDPIIATANLITDFEYISGL